MQIITTLAPPLSELSALAVECFSEYPWNEHWELEEMIRYFSRFKNAGASFVIAYEQEQIVAFGIALRLSNYWDAKGIVNGHPEHSSFYVSALATHRDYRRHGLCTEIMKIFVDQAESSALDAVYVRTRHDNAAAIGIFEQLGFKKCGEQDAETGGAVSYRHIFVFECNN